ncbi:MAG: FAD-dependent oxidoreductase, partial [Candidatus Vogelbacteria bacterium]|nr:FAD-dependent oxidoreductase [Candidatus Vogelbacteria bacterium]
MIEKAIVIGGGVHGITSAIALAEQGIAVVVLEKRDDLMHGTSGATHNRAHLGYHYPRSKETAIECIEGLE